MKCTKCHNITNDNSHFCSTCGAEMDEAVLEIHRQMNESERRTKKSIILFGIVCIIAIITILLLWKGPNPEIYVNEYIYLESGGYEGEGRVFPRVDTKRLTDVIKLLIDGEISEIRQFHISELVNSIELDYEKKDVWKNGDKITIKIDISQLLVSEFEIDFVLDEVDLTVEDLITMREIDPFDYVEIKYVGTLPVVEPAVFIDLESLDIYKERISVVPEGPISEGDEIIITIEGITEEELEKKGIVFTKWSYLHVCDDIDVNRFVWDLDDLSEEVEEQLVGMAENALMNYLTTNQLYYTEITYEGVYLIVSKNNKGSQANCAYFIFTSNISPEEKPDTLVYIPVGITNLILTTDGKYIYDLEAVLPEEKSEVEISRDRYVIGYSDERLMYQSLVGVNKTDYLWDVTPGLEIEE